MMELFLAGTLSGVGCSSPVGLASTGMGPAEKKCYSLRSSEVQAYLVPCGPPAWPSDSHQSQNTSGLFPVSSGGRLTDRHLLDGLQWLRIEQMLRQVMRCWACDVRLYQLTREF